MLHGKAPQKWQMRPIGVGLVLAGPADQQSRVTSARRSAPHVVSVSAFLARLPKKDRCDDEGSGDDRYFVLASSASTWGLSSFWLDRSGYRNELGQADTPRAPK
jgi:hypothetical protein